MLHVILIKAIEIINGDVGTEDNSNNALNKTKHPKIVPKYSFPL